MERIKLAGFLLARAAGRLLIVVTALNLRSGLDRRSFAISLEVGQQSIVKI